MKRIAEWLLLVLGVLFTAAMILCIVSMFTRNGTLGDVSFAGAVTFFFLAFLTVLFCMGEEIRK